MPNLNIPGVLAVLETALRSSIKERGIEDPIMIGIRTGGVWIAEILHHRLGIREPLGKLDISFYRDDFSQIGVNPKVKPSELPVHIEGRDIILVDDVFFTGRTIRAALNEIFDYGRPRQVLLAVLIERNGRQIPMRPDCIGTSLSLQAGQRIKLTGPEPLDLHIQTLDAQAA
jgi:pyrimidine operon attenuation protein/uracil phosphoribosyltransferase